MRSVRVLVFLVTTSGLAVAAGNEAIVVTGEISDTQCAFNIHSNRNSHEDVMKTGVVGRTPEECTRICVRMGGKYVLVDTVNKKIYRIANPLVAVDYAAKRVRVRGMLDEKGVLSITSIASIDAR